MRFARKGASTTEMGLLVGLIAVGIIVAVNNTGDEIANLMGDVSGELNEVSNAQSSGGGNQSPAPEYPLSCKQLYADGGYTSPGVYTLTLGGQAQQAYCRGPYTLVVAQFENDPVTNWNEGIQSDYDPSLASRKGFALSSSQIPSHTQTLFGQGPTPNYCLETSYSTGNISQLAVPNCGDATTSYNIFRNTASFPSGGNPEGSIVTNSYPEWRNMLSVDTHTIRGARRSGADYNWSFAPGVPASQNRGYAYGGGFLPDSSDSSPWTIWVH